MNFCAFLYGFGPDSLFWGISPPHFPLPFCSRVGLFFGLNFHEKVA